MDASALEYERVMEKKKQLLIKIQETKTGIRNKQNQLKILEEGLQKIKDQEGFYGDKVCNAVCTDILQSGKECA